MDQTPRSFAMSSHTVLSFSTNATATLPFFQAFECCSLLFHSNLGMSSSLCLGFLPCTLCTADPFSPSRQLLSVSHYLPSNKADPSSHNSLTQTLLKMVLYYIILFLFKYIYYLSLSWTACELSCLSIDHCSSPVSNI